MGRTWVDLTVGDLARILARRKNDIEAFVQDLDNQNVRYLSWSKLASLEACEQRYLLQYVQRVPLRPEPDYFVKGRLFHEAVARIYRGKQSGRKTREATLHAFVDREWDDDPPHLKNALRLAAENAWEGHEVVCVEEPFVLDLGSELPPLIGVVDLVLRRGATFTVVDHKTGKTFGAPGQVQLAIYREYVRREYGAKRCSVFFDQYRWVNNLGRIRKPAFERNRVTLRSRAWASAVRRLRNGFTTMRKIEEGGTPVPSEPCFACPYRDLCDMRSRVGFYWG